MLQHSFGPYTPSQKKRKAKVAPQKSYPYRVNNITGQKKHLLVIGVTAKAKYDREWFIGEL